ncbi:MAG: alternate ATPase, subunit gamma [Burkholderiaceae bacterium]|nr:alternate ATPase, subunit gamma [Burkholderiaceae bacterium]
MSDTTTSLRRKIDSAGDLRSVVRTMKALAASNIGQYEKSVRALADYYRSVELGLSICFRKRAPVAQMTEGKRPTVVGPVGAVVFGSDQGLVGRFNDAVADYAVKALAAAPGRSRIWAVGERVHARLADASLPLLGVFDVPNSVKAITPLVGQILMESETRYSRGEITELHLFYNRPTSGAIYEPVQQRLLPLDETWRRDLAEIPWPTQNLPEVMGDDTTTLRALIREYLFVSLFRARAASTRNCLTWSPASRPWLGLDDDREYRDEDQDETFDAGSHVAVDPTHRRARSGADAHLLCGGCLDPCAGLDSGSGDPDERRPAGGPSVICRAVMRSGHDPDDRSSKGGRRKPPTDSANIREEVTMLVTFSCPAYANITMFGDAAVRLLKLMGHSGTVPGALLAADLQAALERLEAAVEADEQSPEPESEASAHGEDGEPAVGLSHRALPLIELLKAAAKAKCDVMWDSSNKSSPAV